MKVIALIVPLAAVLAGCHSQSTVEAKNATVAEVANQVAQTASNDPKAIRAGLWSSTVTIEQIDAPGVPAEMVRADEKHDRVRPGAPELPDRGGGQEPQGEFLHRHRQPVQI